METSLKTDEAEKIKSVEKQRQIVEVHRRILAALDESQQQMEKAIGLSDSAFSDFSTPSND